jgi:mannose-1-phosphate guanylyltransferase
MKEYNLYPVRKKASPVTEMKKIQKRTRRKFKTPLKLSNGVYVVILAGGRGERFWPISRKEKPKQVLPLLSSKTLLEDSVLRIKKLIVKHNLYIMCNQELRNSIRRLKILKEAKIIAEPVSRNTAGPIALASALIKKESPHSIIVVLPCDQFIGNSLKFIDSLMIGIEAAALSDKIVTIGIRPTYPATGFGYINIGRRLKEYKKPIFNVESFKEKPSHSKAKEYVKSKKFLWNSGIFIFKSCKMLSLFEKYAPKLLLYIEKIVNSGNFNKNLNIIYPKIKKISIDYCIMEKTIDTLCVKGDFNWCDVGSWESLDHIFPKDKNGNVVKGNFIGLSTRDSIIFGEKSHLIGAIGISGFIIIQTKDTTLICPKSKAQDVRKLVNLLKSSKTTRKFL